MSLPIPYWSDKSWQTATAPPSSVLGVFLERGDVSPYPTSNHQRFAVCLSGPDPVTITLLGWELVPQTAVLNTLTILRGSNKQIRVSLTKLTPAHPMGQASLDDLQVGVSCNSLPTGQILIPTPSF